MTTLDKIKAVINRDTKQHWLDLGDKEEDINKLTVKQFEELERNQKLNDIKLILRHAEMENNTDNTVYKIIHDLHMRVREIEGYLDVVLKAEGFSKEQTSINEYAEMENNNA